MVDPDDDTITRFVAQHFFCRMTFGQTRKGKIDVAQAVIAMHQAAVDRKRIIFRRGANAWPAGRIELINPTTEEALGTAPEAGGDDVDAAVKAARAALRDPAWRDLTAAEAERQASRLPAFRPPTRCT